MQRKISKQEAERILREVFTKNRELKLSLPPPLPRLRIINGGKS